MPLVFLLPALFAGIAVVGLAWMGRAEGSKAQ
jgi:hypothetical protein